MPTESTPLFTDAPSDLSVSGNVALASSATLTTLLGSIQAVLIVLFLFGTTYSPKDYSPSEYVIFRDIMVMLLLGFGFLMTFLRKYGLGAVGFTMMLTVIAVQLNIFVELLCRFLYGDGGSEETMLPLPLSMATFIDGEFSAATLLISYGAIIGRASPVQLVIMALFQSFFYAFNKVVIVLGFLGAEDVGGSMTIHMFGAYFGLAVSYVLGSPKKTSTSSSEPNQVSDIMAMIGTALLWVYWPSFVGATETAVPMNESVCVMHTVLALLGSTGATFYMSQKLCKGKFDPVHITNSTLAGGVAVGSSARLAMTPGGALLLGVLAGVVSVYGYVYSTPMLEKLGVFDTCGVGNLHGWPSLLGGLASVAFVAFDGDAEFLTYGVFSQCVRQFLGVVSTIVVAVGSGYFTGTVMTKTAIAGEVPDEYDDGVWWEGEYFEDDEKAEEH
jgi:ammonium transporter Rh